MIRVFRGQFFLMYTSAGVGTCVHLNVYYIRTIKQSITARLDELAFILTCKLKHSDHHVS